MYFAITLKFSDMKAWICCLYWNYIFSCFGNTSKLSCQKISVMLKLLKVTDICTNIYKIFNNASKLFWLMLGFFAGSGSFDMERERKRFHKMSYGYTYFSCGRARYRPCNKGEMSLNSLVLLLVAKNIRWIENYSKALNCLLNLDSVKFCIMESLTSPTRLFFREARFDLFQLMSWLF